MFMIVPGLIQLNLGFYETNYNVSKFVGLANYVKIFTDENLLVVIRNTFLYGAGMAVGITSLSLSVSLLTFNSSRRLQNYVRFVFFIPFFAAGMVWAMIWKWMYAPDGLINYLLGLAGIERVIWFDRAITGIPAILFKIVLGGSGFQILIYMARILSISPELFEAARVDGLGWWGIRFRVIVPILRPLIALTLLINFVNGMRMYESVYVMAPYDYMSNLMYSIYTTGFLYGHYGLANAQGVVLLALILGVAVIYRRATK